MMQIVRRRDRHHVELLLREHDGQVGVHARDGELCGGGHDGALRGGAQRDDFGPVHAPERLRVVKADPHADHADAERHIGLARHAG